ncbi:MAG: carboxypeptidase regulatory-like domain-containing protein [Planctomycetota bacterium]
MPDSIDPVGGPNPSRPGAPDGSRPSEPQVLEQRLSRLLQKAYRPPQPDPAFQAELLQRMRACQRRGLGARRSWLAPAALAAVLLIGISTFVAVKPPIAPRLEGGTGFHSSSASTAPWSRVDGPQGLAPGDVLALGPADAAVVVPTEHTEIRLDPGTVLRTAAGGQPDHLLCGGAQVTVRNGETHVLATPIIEITARDAEYCVLVALLPPLTPFTQEYLEMNRAKIITGSAVAIGAVVLVSILVIEQSNLPSSVTVRHGDQTLPVETGVTLTFDSSAATATHSDAAAANLAGASAKTGASEATIDPTGAAAIERQHETQVAGVVVDRTGQPLASATVIFRGAETSEGTVAGPVTSDAEGAFSLAIPSTATGEILVSLDRYETATLPWIPAAANIEGGSTGADPTAPAASDPEVSPSPGDTDDDEPAASVLITLEHETAFAGHVTDASTGDPMDTFVLGYQRFEDGWQWFDPVVKSHSATDGSFYVGGVDPGRYRVWVYREGSSRSLPVTIQLQRHEFVEGLAMALEPGVGLTVRVHSERTGAPVEGAVVYSHLDHIPGTVDYVNRTDVDRRLKSASKTDTAGICQLADLRPGAHYLRVLHPDYAPREIELELSASGERDIEVALTDGSNIFGSVIDADGEPMTGATVLAVTMTMRQDLAQVSRGEVDAEGHYIVRNLGAGPYVVVRIDPSAEQDSKVTMSFVNAGKDTQVDFIEVATLATLRGRILNERGDPVPRMSVSAGYLDPVTGFDFQSDVTDEDGRFEIRNLKPRTYSVSVAENFSYSSAVIGSIDIERPIDYDADYTVYDLRIDGRITAADGATAMPDVELILLRVRDGVPSDFAGRGVSNAEGRYEITHLQPGEYQLLASGNQLAPSMTKTFELDATHSGKVTHDFRLEVGAGVRVTVVDSNDVPLSGANVMILNEQGDFVNQGLPPRTNGDGVYEYTRLLAGAYRLEVTLDGRLPGSVTFAAEIGTVKDQRVVLAPGP